MRFASFLLALLLIFCCSLAGCGRTATDTPSETTASTPPDGLSADGKTYYLTDRQGRSIPIPIGRKLAFAGDLAPEISKTASHGGGCVTALTHIPEYVLIIDASSAINFGSGNITAAGGRILCDPDGKPHTASDEYILVLQYYNAKDEVVAPDSQDAVMVWANELLYDFQRECFFWMSDLWYDLEREYPVTWSKSEYDGLFPLRNQAYTRLDEGVYERTLREYKNVVTEEGSASYCTKECFYTDNWELLEQTDSTYHSNNVCATRAVTRAGIRVAYEERDENNRPILSEARSESGELLSQGAVNADGIFVRNVYYGGQLVMIEHCYYDDNGNLTQTLQFNPDGTLIA